MGSPRATSEPQGPADARDRRAFRRCRARERWSFRARSAGDLRSLGRVPRLGAPGRAAIWRKRAAQRAWPAGPAPAPGLCGRAQLSGARGGRRLHSARGAAHLHQVPGLPYRSGRRGQAADSLRRLRSRARVRHRTPRRPGAGVRRLGSHCRPNRRPRALRARCPAAGTRAPVQPRQVVRGLRTDRPVGGDARRTGRHCGAGARVDPRRRADAARHDRLDDLLGTGADRLHLGDLPGPAGRSHLHGHAIRRRLQARPAALPAARRRPGESYRRHRRDNPATDRGAGRGL